MGMIDHIDIRVSDLDASRDFYEAVLAPLGIAARPERTDPAGARQVGFAGRDGIEFSLHEPAAEPGQDVVTGGAHIAFRAADERMVRAFHRAGTERGATGIGPPDRRPQYGDGYFGAFLLDPDGNNVEAVAHIGRGGDAATLPGSLEP
jgi:catechol 2,3-dioxygenase-like lactoylglutathione lyase family enzyme